MVSNQLIHSLINIPTFPEGFTINDFIPDEIDNSAASQLLFRADSAGHIAHPTAMTISFKAFPAFCILYCTKGTGSVVISDKTFELTSGSLIIFDCTKSFSINSTHRFEYDIIYYNGPQSAFFYNNMSNTDENICYLPAFSQTGLSSSLRPLLPSGGQSSHISPIMFNRYMTDFFTDTIGFVEAPRAKKEDTLPEYLLLSKEYIDNNFYENISLDALEERFFVNRYRLCKDFTRVYFVSPIQYLHQVRINRAKVLLTETTLKIHEIGYQVGYETSTQFINHFKKHTGVTPAVYRDRIK